MKRERLRKVLQTTCKAVRRVLKELAEAFQWPTWFLGGLSLFGFYMLSGRDMAVLGGFIGFCVLFILGAVAVLSALLVTVLFIAGVIDFPDKESKK